jgi:hypothetical protein
MLQHDWMLIVYNNKQTRSLQYNMTECWFCTTTNKLEVYSTAWLNVDCVQQQQTRGLQYNMTECWFCTTTNKLEVYSTTWLNVDSVQQQQTRSLQYNMTECWLCTTTTNYNNTNMAVSVNEEKMVNCKYNVSE